MTSEANLLKEIQLDPTNRDLRMVYADAVQDEGSREAEEVAVFIRACVEKKKPKWLPKRYRDGIDRALKSQRVYWDGFDRPHLEWSGAFAARIGLFGNSLTLINGFFAVYTGTAVGGWDDLGNYLYDNHVMTHATITDNVGLWLKACERRRDPVHRTEVFGFGDRYVVVSERERLVRNLPHALLTAYDLRARFFHRSWPRIKFTFEEAR